MGPAHSRDRGTPVVPYGNSGSAQRTKQFNEKELKIMKMYLSSFIFETKSTETHRKIVSSHWDLVFNSAKTGTGKSQTNGRVTELYDVFYALLEDQSPELKHVFRSSMQVRGKVLVHISIGMRTLLTSDKLAERITNLTQTHRRFGVKVDYYNAVGLALIHALKVTSGEHWSPEIEDAWERLFSHSSLILITDQLKSDKKQLLGALGKSKSFLARAGPSMTMFNGDLKQTSRSFFSKSFPSTNCNSVRDSTQTTTAVTVATNGRWAGSTASARGPSPSSKREAESTGRSRQPHNTSAKRSGKSRYTHLFQTHRVCTHLYPVSPGFELGSASAK